MLPRQTERHPSCPSLKTCQKNIEVYSLTMRYEGKIDNVSGYFFFCLPVNICCDCLSDPSPFGRLHGAPYRGYGYVTLRFGGGGMLLGEWEHNNNRSIPVKTYLMMGHNLIYSRSTITFLQSSFELLSMLFV